MHCSKTFPSPVEKTPSKIKTLFRPTQFKLMGKVLRLKLLRKKCLNC